MPLFDLAVRAVIFQEALYLSVISLYNASPARCLDSPDVLNT